jgi:hypothetical protein
LCPFSFLIELLRDWQNSLIFSMSLGVIDFLYCFPDSSLVSVIISLLLPTSDLICFAFSSFPRWKHRF